MFDHINLVDRSTIAKTHAKWQNNLLAAKVVFFAGIGFAALIVAIKL